MTNKTYFYVEVVMNTGCFKCDNVQWDADGCGAETMYTKDRDKAIER